MGANPRGHLRACSLAVRESLRAFIDQAGAPPALVVGLSGGADSLALALTVIDVADRLGIPVVTVTVDHGLREGSGLEARRVADLAASWGARALVDTVTVDGRGGPEGAARDARRAALRAVARRECAPILLGHTMDDQAETVLLRLARGSGPSSLRAIAPISRDADGVTWLRPLLGLRRGDTEGACAQAGLTPVHDPTNDVDGPWRAADGSALRRSAVRQRAIPALASALGVDPVPALARTAALCAADDDALNDWARTLTALASDEQALAGGAPHVGEGERAHEPAGASSLRVADLVGAPRAVRARCARRPNARASAPCRGRTWTPSTTWSSRGGGRARSRCPAAARAESGALAGHALSSRRACVSRRCCAHSENLCLPGTTTRLYGTLIVQPLAEHRYEKRTRWTPPTWETI